MRLYTLRVPYASPQPFGPRAGTAPGELQELQQQLVERRMLAGMSQAATLWREPARWLYERRVRHVVDVLDKSIGARVSRAYDDLRPAEQGTITNPVMQALSMYETHQGIADKTHITFGVLRDWGYRCPPATACIETEARQKQAFAQLTDGKPGPAASPGFKVVMSDPDEEASPDDRKRMRAYEHFILECGLSEPPEDERPIGYQPGFDYFVGQLSRNAMLYGWAPVRTWAADPATDPAGEWPVLCFSTVDASLIRNAVRPDTEVVAGVQHHGDVPSDRSHFPRTSGRDIRWVKVDGAGEGHTPMEWYTTREMCVYMDRPRGDDIGRGYGLGETELAWDCIQGYVWALDSNLSRFRLDHLPRGVFVMMGNMDPHQRDMFKLEWTQLMGGMMKGTGNRWNVPFIKGLPGVGSSVNWIPLDMSPRDMEHSQFSFALSVMIHSVYGKHPEETGYAATNPFRPPLSEASPEVRIEHAQDSGFRTRMTAVANFINRSILWRLRPDRRYRFTWAGMGESDEAQAVQVAGGALSFGLTTPRMEWARRDQTIPDSQKDAQYWDLPMPPAEGLQMLMQAQQLEAAQQAQQQAMQEQQQQATAAAAGQAATSMQEGAPSGPLGGPPGGPAGGPAGGPDIQSGGPDSTAGGPTFESQGSQVGPMMRKAILERFVGATIAMRMDRHV